MMRSLNVAMAAILFATPALAGPGGAGSTVNISTTSSTIYSDRITEVAVADVGTHVFPDQFTAPETSQQSAALETALVALGFPPGTNASILGLEEIGDDETAEESFTSNYNPVDNPDYVIGDPEDYFTWIAVGPEDVNVFVTQVVTLWTFYRLNSEIPDDCAAGSYSATGQEPCTPCSTGTHQPSTGANSCINCAAGSASSVLGASQCTPCEAGEFSNEGATLCSDCSPGTFSDMPGTAECSNCAAGYHAADAGSTMCTPCDAGEYSAEGSATCTSCNAGTFSASGSGLCSPCPTGSFSSQGAGMCTPCAPGTFASFMGSPSCTDCGAGTFELDPGSSVCDPCPGGQATPCNGNGVCSDGPSGNGTCVCNAGYSGFACENGPPTTTVTSTTTTTDTSTTTTTLLAGPCADLPETGCVAATVAGLQIQTSTDPAKDKLKWKLGGGSLEVSHAALGDPSALTSWTLCIYDSTAGVPFLAGSITVDPSSTLWTEKEGKGWKYKDKAGSQSGVTGVSLKPGVAGKPKAQVKGAGTSLPLPLPFDATSFFDQGSTVTVQLVKDGGAGGELCWTSEFDAADTKLNTPSKFKATAK